MRQDVYQNLPVQQLEDHFDDIVSSAYSVSLFTDWQDERINQVWLKQARPGQLMAPHPLRNPRCSGRRSPRQGGTPWIGLSGENCPADGRTRALARTLAALSHGVYAKQR